MKCFQAYPFTNQPSFVANLIRLVLFYFSCVTPVCVCLFALFESAIHCDPAHEKRQHGVSSNQNVKTNGSSAAHAALYKTLICISVTFFFSVRCIVQAVT